MLYHANFIIFFILMSIAGLNGQKLDRGLIAHYLFNGDLIDNTGYANNGVSNGGLQFDLDRFGSKCGALKFNGRDGFVSVPSSRSLKSPVNQISVTTWFRIDKKSGPLKWLTVICKSNLIDELDNSPQYRFQVTSKTISINTDFTEEQNIDIDFDTWYHYALVYDGQAVRSYLNGSKVFEFAYTKSFSANNMPLEIGRDLPGAQEYMAGSLDDLRIYNRGLSDREIQQIYNDKSEMTSPKPCQSTASQAPTPVPIPIPVPAPIPTPPDVSNPPVVTIATPGNSPFNTTQKKEAIIARIENVKNKQSIEFKINGSITTNFTFDSKKEVFQAKVNLEPGFNQFEISATNTDGTDMAATIINYKEPVKPQVVTQLLPPIITISDPIRNPHFTSESNQVLIADIQNVKSAKEITYKVNGQISTQFKYNTAKDEFESWVQLAEGNNVYEIIATNADGRDAKSGIIKYEPTKKPPKITVLLPTANPDYSREEESLLKATIENISNAQFISLTLNGEDIGDFEFDASSKLFTANFKLDPGFNIFEISAKNNDGQDRVSGRIHYEPTLISPLAGEVNVKYELELETSTIELVCFDHKKADGDTVSIILNEFVIADKIRLEPKGKGEFRQKLNLTPQKEYVIISKAWNLGLEPPNTMTMEIYSGTKLLKTIKLESEIGKSEAIKIIYKKT